MRRFPRVLLAALAAATALVSLQQATASAVDSTPPARVVPTTFGFGLHAGNDTTGIKGWMPRSGSPWDYAYRYIGGGINRGGTTNWTEWAPDATYPITYAASAASKGYTPVFTYYSINAARGTCYAVQPACSEPQVDLTNLNTPSVMSLYYADFARLMQRLGTGTYDGVAGYGKDAIVHVEPDLSGFAENAVLSSAKCFGFCNGVGNDPSRLKASVRSSGFADAAAFPDTYRGFNQVLLALRDKYAPNVRLAVHLSNWSTLYDINSATVAGLDVTSLGTKAGLFAAASGAAMLPGSSSTYDLVFNDVSNKDAGYYTYVLNKPRFWDVSNVTFPNFHRWEDYVKAATTAANKQAIVWQVPMGNQWFQTMNNTPGHYQDNRAEYIFSHVSELRDAGIVGVLFGSTIDDATHYWDANGDGITNPPSTCTVDGISIGIACNDHASIVTDDDGGFLRQAGLAYYRSPLPLAP